MDKFGNRTSQVQQRVKFDGTFCLAETGPRKQRQAQRDRRGIQRIDRCVQIDSKVLSRVELAGVSNEHLSEVCVDAPIACLVGIGQVVA